MKAIVLSLMIIMLSACSASIEVEETTTVAEEELEEESTSGPLETVDIDDLATIGTTEETEEDIPLVPSQWYEPSTIESASIDDTEDIIEYKGEGYFVLTDKNYENWRQNEVCDKVYLEDVIIIENSQERVVARLQSLSQNINVQLLPTLDEDLGSIELGGIYSIYAVVDSYDTEPVMLTVDNIYQEATNIDTTAIIANSVK